MNVAIDSQSSVEVKTLVVLVRIFVRSPNEKLFDLAQNHPKLFLGKSSDIDTKTAHESETVGKKKGTDTSESKYKTSKSDIASAFAHAHVKPKKTPEKSNELKEVTKSKVSSRINSKTDTLIRSDQDIDPSDKQQSTKTTKKR